MAKRILVGRTVGLIALLTVAACSSEAWRLAGKGGRESGSDSPPSETAPANKPTEEPRPTDESEGVPGYLTDPDLLTVVVTGGRASAKGAPGAVGGEKVKAEGTEVSLYGISVWELEQPRTVDGGRVEVPATLIATGRASADGSFELEGVTTSAGEILAVAVNTAREDILVVPETPEGRPTVVLADVASGASPRPLSAADLTADGGASMRCAIGKLPGETGWVTMMATFPGNEIYHCRPCDMDKPLPDTHPFAGLMTDAHPCKTTVSTAPGALQIKPPNQAQQNFMTFDNGNLCSQIPHGCGFNWQASYFGHNVRMAGEGYSTRYSAKWIWVQCEQLLDTRSGAVHKLRDPMQPWTSELWNVPESACAGARVALGPGGKVTGCRLPLAGGMDALTALQCMTKGTNVHGGTDPAEVCDVVIEPAGTCSDPGEIGWWRDLSWTGN